MSVLDEYFTLSNGVRLPKLSLGTWLMAPDEAEKAVKDAISLGYRGVDTAEAYGNEAGVGRAIKDRDSIFITTKLKAEYKSYKDAQAAIDKSLIDLDLNYIDLMLIHSPQPWAEVNQSDNRYKEGNLEAWRALEDGIRAGKIRAIGVSNFLQEDLDNIIANSSIKPMVNQILAHISNTPFELIEYSKAKEMIVEAYSPIAHGMALRNETIKEMASKYAVSPSQLCLRYCLELGLAVLPKTSNMEHMKSNIELDFTISKEDMEKLKNIERIKDYGEASFFPVYGGKL